MSLISAGSISLDSTFKPREQNGHIFEAICMWNPWDHAVYKETVIPSAFLWGAQFSWPMKKYGFKISGEEIWNLSHLARHVGL
jgi:hypothetical protein